MKVSNPHTPCGDHRLRLGDTGTVGVGWASLLPDAEASVDVLVGGERVRFTGVGYHDKVCFTLLLRVGCKRATANGRRTGQMDRFRRRCGRGTGVGAGWVRTLSFGLICFLLGTIQR
jgi:hypothetical protein